MVPLGLEDEYRRGCTNEKNLVAILFSLCCMLAGRILLLGK